MISTRAVKMTTAAILALIVIIFAGCSSKEETNENGAKAVPVTVSEAKTESISSNTVVTGKVAAQSEVQIVPKIPGKVERVPVDVGTRVKKGDLLIKIDTTDLEIALSQAINGMQNAQLTHNQAVLNYNNAKANYERIKSLYAEGAVSQQQMEQAELQYNLAKDAMNQPVVASAQDQIADIRNKIADATITSPFDGEVATRSIDPGEMAGAVPVMSVVNIDKVFIEGTVAESDIALVEEGQEVTVRVDAAGGVFQGVIKTLSPVADPNTKGYPVRVEVNNPDRKLKPGMFAEIQLTMKQKENTVVIRKEALVTRGSDKILYVVKGNAVEERIVETGIEAEDRIEIVKGLAAGEKFVIEGQHSLYDKAEITVKSGN
ncbi:MAG: hypothetical protein CVU89_05420 [Firmicutes bacterium HGW-Firmicutes-14]|nr:MAG: hypothetical protein CVU89_05420 [Firmicutes bacterium HGW-Firmicutes-14]